MENRVMLKGDTVQLLPFSPMYWDHIAKWFYDKEYKNFFRQYGRMFTEDDFKQYDKIIGGEVFLIHSLKEAKVIGFIQLTPCSKKNRGGFIGLLLDNSVHGQRISNEATWLFLDYLFNRQGFNKVMVEILESDLSLKKALEKTGWYKEGKLLQECYMDGKYLNEIRYSMSAYYFNKTRSKLLEEQRIWADSLKA